MAIRECGKEYCAVSHESAAASAGAVVNWWSDSGPLASVFGGEGEGEGAELSRDLGKQA